eukprot:8759611-Pyramimonas_sp.AAC.2
MAIVHIRNVGCREVNRSEKRLVTVYIVQQDGGQRGDHWVGEPLRTGARAAHARAGEGNVPGTRTVHAQYTHCTLTAQ